MRYPNLLRWGTLVLSTLIYQATTAEQADRTIEEVIVTAEKRQSTVSDTSISITAFDASKIDDFGLQGADELVNFIPATTRDAYDIRIRGVGRNFRALGGDTGVATYYNGVYSEDFGIAASENGLYDVERIEVLRGPQGTLYGRNAIGGALNYISNRPTSEMEGEFRAVAGNFSAREFYGFLSGPLIDDRVNGRLTFVKRDRDGVIKGQDSDQDFNSIDDQNISLSLEWDVSEDWSVYVRWNDRASDRAGGGDVLLTDGIAGDRGNINASNYARGLRPVAAGTAGALGFRHPGGSTLWGLPNRPGVDSAGVHPNPAFGLDASRLPTNIGLNDIDNPVVNNGLNSERFDQNGVQLDVTWDLSDAVSVKYLLGWQDFDYTLDLDFDYVDADFSQRRQTALEAVETSSHELQVLWQLGDALQMTSGVYLFNSDRLQNYALRDAPRFTQAYNYGNLAGFLPFITGISSEHARIGSSDLNQTLLGPWQGDPGGAHYEHFNTAEVEAVAVYTQGTYTFNEEWALTAGLRWAEDRKDVYENRTGYNEFHFLDAALDNSCDTQFSTDCSALGLTPLAIANVFSGAATATFNPANPIVPTCTLGEMGCATPLLLEGFPLSFAMRAEDNETWGDTSFRINLDWTPNEETLVYFSITTGYRAGGYSLGVLDARTGSGSTGDPISLISYDQEEVVAYEMGHKGTFLDGQLQVNSSIYRYNYDNYQDQVDVFSTVRQTSADFVKNADSAENFGIETEITWLVNNSLTLGGNASYANTEYTASFLVLEDSDPNYPIGLFNETTTDGRDAFLIKDFDGNQLRRIPNWKATMWTDYEWRLDQGTVNAIATMSYTGSYYSTGFERELDHVPDRLRLDVALTWRDNQETWQARVFVDNVTDRRQPRNLNASSYDFNYRLRAPILDPRYFGVDVTYRFR